MQEKIAFNVRYKKNMPKEKRAKSLKLFDFSFFLFPTLQMVYNWNVCVYKCNINYTYIHTFIHTSSLKPCALN